MENPLFIRFYSERIGKPLSAFTKDDWRRAAIGAAQLLDAGVPKPKRRGRPPKQYPTRLADLLRLNQFKQFTDPQQPKRSRGRPQQQYGKDRNYSIEMLAEIVSDITSPEARKRWPDEAPWSKAEAVRELLRSIGHPVSYDKAVLRAIRRLESGQKSRTIAG